MKRLVISAASVFFSVFLLSMSTPAQTRFGGTSASQLSGSGGGGGGSYGSTSGIQRSPLAVFHVTVVSGTSEYQPSSFMAYDQAVAAGKAQSACGAYMSFPQALAKGTAKAAVQGPVPAVQAADHVDSEGKSRVVFVQDDSGRIVRSASSSGAGEIQ